MLKKEGGNVFSNLHKVKTTLFSRNCRMSTLNVLEHNSLKRELSSISVSQTLFRRTRIERGRK